MVTGEYFDVYGVPALLGRTIGPEDDQFGGPKVVVLGYGVWQRRFGGEDVLGQEVVLGGESHTVVGVMPKGFHERLDVFVPMAYNYEESNRGAHFWGMRGRLAEGVSEERGLEDLKTIAARLEQEYPDSNTGWTVIMSPLRDLILRDFDSVVRLLFGAVFLVLLIACTNVANLLLARMATREKEVALRSALGAGRGQILGQFLVESLLLALLGGGLGLFLAAQGTKILAAMNADGIPRSSEIQLDLGVVLFTLALSVLTGLVFGLLPALKASRPDLAVALKEGGRGQAGGFEGKRVRQLLVLGEVALAVMLLVGAGLLLRSFSRLMAVDPGFQAKGALTAVVELPAAEYGEDNASQSAFFHRLFDELAALPGVESAGGVIPMPLTGAGFVLSFAIEGDPPAEPGKEPGANMRIVSEDYFATMGIPLKQGRVFDRSDEPESTQVMVVNERFVERHLQGKEPLGQRINFSGPEEPDWITIIGVVGDVHHEDLAEETGSRSLLALRPAAVPAHHHGGADRWRSHGIGGPGAGGGAKHQPQPAGLQRAIPRGIGRDFGERFALPEPPAGPICWTGAASGGHWSLWGDQLRGESAASRDRCAHGVGGSPGRNLALRSARRARLGGDRCGGGVGGVAVRRAGAGEHGVRHEHPGLRHLWRSGCAYCTGGPGGLPDPCSKGHAGGSGGRASGGVSLRRP